eukprot:sb/3472563/
MKQHGVEDKGKILIGDMTKLSDAVGGQKFTHVLVLGCLFYIHDSMDAFLEQLKGFCEPGAWIVIQDFSRTVSLDKIRPVMRHWRTEEETLETGDYLKKIMNSGYQLQYYNNDNNDFAKRSMEAIFSTGQKLVESGELPKDAFTYKILRGNYKMYFVVVKICKLL